MNNRIVVASILKPTDDVRGYWKIAQSLVKTNKYDVNIIGNRGKFEIDEDNIRTLPHEIDRTQWVKRIALRYTVLFRILRIRPWVLIICTHELLIAAVLAKWICGSKIVYDIQENYQSNASMAGPLGKLLGRLIRLKEHTTSLIIDDFWLAEKCYVAELPFVNKKFTVVQNKPLDKKETLNHSKNIKALFSGTISDYSGARIAMEIMIKLAARHDGFEGHFIGQIHDAKLSRWLQGKAIDQPSIKLTLSERAIAYEEIVEEMRWANIGIISYLPNTVNQAKVPTKLYDYARYQVPYLIQEGTLWHKIGQRLGGAIGVNYHNLSEDKIAIAVQNSEDLFQKPFPINDTWEHESLNIINSIDRLLI